MRNWMKNFLILGLSFFALISFQLHAAQPSENDKKTYRLLILDSQKGSPYDEIRAALIKTLEAGGYSNGKNLQIKAMVIGNDVKEGERILNEEVKSNYNVIYVGGTVATMSAKNVLFGKNDQHVVFAGVVDPVGVGVIKNFTSKPEANFTGVSVPLPVKSRLRFVKQLMPKVKTFGFIHADMPQSVSYNHWIQDLISSDPEFKDMKIIFRAVPLIKGEDGDRLMAESAMNHVKELDPIVDAYIKSYDQLGARKNFSEMFYANSKRPLIGTVKDDVMGRWGATAVIYPIGDSTGEQAGTMIKTLFQGGKIADITPEWPKKFGFAVDLPKTRQFDIKVPVEILQLAGENIIK